jgi:hypothetical protein
MEYLIYNTYIDPATNRLVMTTDPVQLSTLVPAPIQPSNASSVSTLPQERAPSTSLSYILATLSEYTMSDYIPQPAPFNGNPALLVIDKTKVPELYKNTTIDDKESPSLVTGDKLSTDSQDRDVVNQENRDPQANQPPPTNKKRPKRKAGCLEMDTQVKEQDGSSTKRRKNVLKSRKENKSAPASISGQDKKLSKCHLCTFTSNRRFNLTTHLKTHDPNRVKEFVCSECKTEFTRKHDLERHVTNVHK